MDSMRAYPRAPWCLTVRPLITHPVGVAQDPLHSVPSGGNRAEVIVTPDTVFLRDSKDPAGPVLEFTPDEWATFAGAVKAGTYDAPRPSLAAVPDHLRPPELQDHPHRGRRPRRRPLPT